MMDVNQIHVIDCIEFMQSYLKESIVDLVVTSPPYGDLRMYHGYFFNYQIVIKELYRVIKPGGVIVWIIGDQTINGSESGSAFKHALYFKEVGFNLHDTMIWDKGACSYPASRSDVRYGQQFEYMFIFSKGKPKTVNLICDHPNKYVGTICSGTKRKRNGELQQRKKKKIPSLSIRSNIWKCLTGHGHDYDFYQRNHPATFPKQLAKDHIISWSNHGDLVYDPFCGSGTTCLMAKITNRNYIGTDVSEQYCELARKRIEDLSYRQEKETSTLKDMIK